MTMPGRRSAAGIAIVASLVAAATGAVSNHAYGAGYGGAFDYCDQTQPISMTVDFANDHSNPMNPALMRWSGRVECHGVDELRINQISVQREVTRGLAVGAAHPGKPDMLCVSPCGVATGRGSARTDGPGAYEVTFKVTVRKAPGPDRTATLQYRWLTAGLGPAVLEP